MNVWWQDRALRIFHPNPAEAEVADMDVDAFVEACATTHAEAVVVSTGGIYAFYPSEIPYHHVSPVIGDRDLIGEITRTAHVRGLRIIARVDFSKVRAEVYADHPEWVVRRHDGTPGRRRGYYLTCPVAGYQNEAFAYPVIEEILSRYGVDGFHLNAGGFHGLCTCEACDASFGEPIPTGPEDDPEAWLRYLRWRREALADQLRGYYRVMRALAPGVFFMGELAGQEYAAWSRGSGAHFPALSDAFSQVLVSSGGMRHARESRWWVGMSADRVRASGNRPLINIKVHMRDLNINQTVMPPAEFAFLAYQAISHGAGLKLPLFGIPATLADPRAIPAVREVFGMMDRQRRVLDTMEPVALVGLVWPDRALLRGDLSEVDAEGLAGAFAGLYGALKARHVQVRVLTDADLGEDRLVDLNTLVAPTAAYWTDAEAEAVVRMASRGGRVVLLDSPAAALEGYPPLPDALRKALKLEAQSKAAEVPYGLPAADAPEALVSRGPLPLRHPYRRVTAPPDAELWLWAACGEMGVPEDADTLRTSEDPLVFRTAVGGGDVIYAAMDVGQTVMDLGHIDHVDLLETMLTYDRPDARILTSDAPSQVDMVLARWAQGWVVHLVNGVGSAPLDAPAPVGPITLRLALEDDAGLPDAATWITPGEPTVTVPITRDEGWVRAVIPSLEAYGQLVLKRGCLS